MEELPLDRVENPYQSQSYDEREPLSGEGEKIKTKTKRKLILKITGVVLFGLFFFFFFFFFFWPGGRFLTFFGGGYYVFLHFLSFLSLSFFFSFSLFRAFGYSLCECGYILCCCWFEG